MKKVKAGKVNCLESERVNSLKVTAFRLDVHVWTNSSALWRNLQDWEGWIYGVDIGGTA